MKKLILVILALLTVGSILSNVSTVEARSYHYSYRPHIKSYNNGSATALCRDGTFSYSLHRRGTCSHHGGVEVWE